MDIREVRRLVFGGEGINVEFKRKVKYPEKIVREVVAFANTRGGHLFIGVDDNGTIPGIKFAEEEDFIMQKAISDLCRPTIPFESEIIPLNEKYSVIHYHIKESKSKPHYAFLKKEHRYGKAFVRIEDRSVQASYEIRKILKNQNVESKGAFEYGEKEQILLRFLDQNNRITLKQFKELSKLPYRKASDVLINLAVNNVIRIIPGEGEDWFEFAE
jgi:predicted HTH transcriptional regulator